ncbi:MAG: hypothetical protein ABH886_10775 [Candidatus Desantisbacteria bacterium]
MYNYAQESQDELVTVFSPISDKKFVIDPREKIIHLSTCPSLEKRQKENHGNTIVHHGYQKCPICLG